MYRINDQQAGLKQCKRIYSLQQFLPRQGVRMRQSWILTLSGKGWWQKQGTPQAHEATGTSWFKELGLYRLSLHITLQSIAPLKETAVSAAGGCTVV